MVTAAAAYMLGSIPTGFLAGKAQGIDIRSVGSGNIGATNVFRSLGKTAGTLVLLADAAKGFLACLLLPKLALLLAGSGAEDSGSLSQHLAMVGGLMAILGHNYTCWLRFKGGKGIATTAGVFLALAPLAIAMLVVLWAVVFAVTRYVSVASIASAVGLPITVGLTGGHPVLTGLSVGLGALAIYKHKANLRRLRDGTEHRFGQKKNPEETT